MKLGLLVEVEEGLTWERWRPLFGAAERLGFDSVWVSDHLCSPSGAVHGLDAWVALSVAAAETSSIGLGTLVTPVTFRPAAIVARMAESVQALSGGRLTVGLGLGWNQREHAHHGIEFPPAPERAQLLERGVAMLRGTARVLIGGAGERLTLPLVARLADEWNMTTASAMAYSAKSQVLTRLCSEVGRDPCSIGRSVASGYLIGRDADEIGARQQRVRQWGTHDTSGWLVGTPEEIVSGLRALAEVGVERVMLGHYVQDDLEALELVAHEVMPRLR